MRRASWLLLVLATLVPAGAHGGGVLVPATLGDNPDPNALALRTMDVKVAIDGAHAEVRVEQVWENRTDGALEGRYEFALAPGAALEAFSLWEGERRLHGVVIEKKHGKRLYEDLTARAIDPGLVETGDRDAGEDNLVVLRVAPIPAHGTTRVLLVYDEPLALGSLTAQLAVPLGPHRHQAQPVGELRVNVDVRSNLPMQRVELAPAAWWKAAPRAPAGTKSYAASWQAQKLSIENDLVVKLRLEPPAGGLASEVIAYRDPAPPRDASAFADFDPKVNLATPSPGFFVARVVLAPAAKKKAGVPRDVVFVVDASPSMQWDKLEIAFAALEYALGQRLDQNDRFGIVLFNDETHVWKAALEPATPANTAAALTFVRQSYLAGGTDLGGGVAAGMQLLAAAPRAGADLDLVVISDGRPTWGEIEQRPLEERIVKAVRALKGARLYALGIGEDGDDLLLDAIATPTGGTYARLHRVGDDADVTRAAFFDRLAGRAVSQLGLTMPAGAHASAIYGPSQAWEGGDAVFVGRYATPLAGTATLAGRDAGGAARSYPLPISLPDADTARPWVARWWAMARVHDLLDRIRLDGERGDWIAEIIALAKRFRLVTPYTSFIAAPRALLRPRNFQAGDPILRVKTGAEVKGVIAVFPWGLTKPLAYVADEDVWETRFLAPAWMKDGSYACTLVLTDDHGRKLREDKRFTVDSTPPELHVELGHGVVRPGEKLRVTAHADADVRRISARLGDGAAVDVRWSGADKASVGELVVPDDAPAGPLLVHVVAEDFARNTTVTSEAITVVR